MHLTLRVLNNPPSTLYGLLVAPCPYTIRCWFPSDWLVIKSKTENSVPQDVLEVLTNLNEFSSFWLDIPGFLVFRYAFVLESFSFVRGLKNFRWIFHYGQHQKCSCSRKCRELLEPTSRYLRIKCIEMVLVRHLISEQLHTSIRTTSAKQLSTPPPFRAKWIPNQAVPARPSSPPREPYPPVQWSPMKTMQSMRAELSS